MSFKGKHHSPETREKISAALKGRSHSPQHRAKVSASLARPEVRAKIGAALRAAMSLPEYQEKQRAIHLGKHHSPETREKLRQARLGKVHSPETREKLRAATRAAMSRPEYREKLRQARLGKHHTPEVREKIRQANLGKHHTPETLERMSGERNHSWRGGISFEPYCLKFSDDFRERVRGFWEYRCGLCGKTQVENGRALSVHHVHYLKEACCDEMIKPLFVPLCMTCHSKTNSGDRNEWEAHFTQVITEKHGGQCYLSKPMEGVR